MKPYIAIAEKTKADAMKIFEIPAARAFKDRVLEKRIIKICFSIYLHVNL